MSTYSKPSFSSSLWNRGAVWMCKLGLDVLLLINKLYEKYRSRRVSIIMVIRLTLLQKRCTVNYFIQSER